MRAVERELKEQVRNASINRYMHFDSAESHNSWNSWIGVPVIVINVVLGSVLLWAISQELPEIMQWIAAGLALVAALLSGIQTFFSFNRMFHGHRRLGSKYLEIVRDTEYLLSLKEDGRIDDDELIGRAEVLFKSYKQINRDSESFPTNRRIFKRALEQEETRVLTRLNRINEEVGAIEKTDIEQSNEAVT